MVQSAPFVPFRSSHFSVANRGSPFEKHDENEIKQFNKFVNCFLFSRNTLGGWYIRFYQCVEPILRQISDHSKNRWSTPSRFSKVQVQ